MAMASEHDADPHEKTGLFLDGSGRWFHDGEPVRHARLAALLSRSIARAEDGSLIVTTGRDRLPFVALDTPLHVRTLRVSDGATDGGRVVSAGVPLVG
jgi:hypothetical protein